MYWEDCLYWYIALEDLLEFCYLMYFMLPQTPPSSLSASSRCTKQSLGLGRVQEPGLEDTKNRKTVKDLQFRKLLPDSIVQRNLMSRWAVLVSRIVTKYLKPFNFLRKRVVWHIPHPYSKEMAQRSTVCCLGMEFLNPNVAGDMAQLLQHNQEKYVPVIVKEDSTSTVLACILLHGDQLFEERARNVKWTFRDGLDPVERIDGIDTEFADWHAKYTLYKMEYKIFFDHSSAGELSTSMASTNRTGISNAAKGVENHYNEYSEFHLRETEGHVVASFMEMMGMKNMEDKPHVILPDATVSPTCQGKWFLEVCEDYVKKFVF
ncbi:uncharacterized protein LOC122951395 [Acropora millepora]|uniref:uncharacterized protein LOC122951395 n=1 Tax=Acropora millepora TaxID=45264 RepID=UPI001CF48DA2|nr:uncharacterized protein LOC122951395 [Acropora millepora]